MPREPRTDKPEALHHIIARGIERTKIFQDGTDRNHFFAAEDRSNSRGYPDVTAFDRERSRVTARSLLCYWAVRDLGLSMAEISRR